MQSTSRLDMISEVLTSLNQPPFRLKQLTSAVYKEQALKYEDLSNISKEVKEALLAKLGPDILTLKKADEVKGRQVHKVLFETKDGHHIESVRMEYLPNAERGHSLYSLCLSSQVGCAMDCKFCATGAVGFKRNLTK